MTVSVTESVRTSTATKLDAVENSTSSDDLSRLRPHTLVTKDFDEHRFQAAASRQIQWPVKKQSLSSDETDRRLIASPYNDPPHLLDLTSLDTQSRLLSLAFAFFRPVRDDYAMAGYLDSFNWNEVFDLLRAFSKAEGHSWTRQSFYVVSFRSILLPNVDQDHLYALDAYSHQEATASGGLLKYWFGAKNEKQQNLATCIWRNREDARLGGRGPWHAKARAAARELYREIVFSTMRLVVEDGVQSWSIDDWKEDA
ncbi:hypothetical protein N7492_010269 [Penicillium capsulatum]|uniref:Uncharacterized protein n=1 Tax=Penicillium capsulatum TaxID=69766 RepID=A0A9W9LES4_9EURO|nr:hypothetical protein N7492_010269 [Penicillium capsulatum]KAJ6112776.1 hypothetical protein N7512_008100 [Penicillium capsulatum]